MTTDFKDTINHTKVTIQYSHHFCVERSQKNLRNPKVLVKRKGCGNLHLTRDANLPIEPCMWVDLWMYFALRSTL